MRRQRKAKILATLGPASSTHEQISALFKAGADVFRLNFSHGSHEDHQKRYELIRAIEELTGGAYVPSPGMVYPTLTMLDEMGHVAETKSDGARKVFAVTPDGTAHLAERKAEVDALFARLAELASQQERTDAAPVRRAMNSLREALIHRLGRDGVQKQTVHDAVAIIDEAAQRIERL